LEQVVEAVGAATVSGTVEITFDQSATLINDAAYSGGQRAQKTAEILQIIDLFRQYIVRQSDVAQP
jgi:hypothetical protein